MKSAIPLSFSNEYKPKIEYYVQLASNWKAMVDNIGIRASAQKKVLSQLVDGDDPVRTSNLSEFASNPLNVCRAMEKKGLVHLIKRPKVYDPFDLMAPGKKLEINLSDEQQNVFEELIAAQSAGKFSPFLLHGVTGSGKTEVYLKLAQKVIADGKSVLVLVPEISLTPQVAKKFRNTFGDKVALWHSAMTRAEKGWTWQQLKEGKYTIIVGARSAVLTPLANLGLIIVDEEQESSYKQENSNPFYHARDVALIRAKQAKAMVLMASATPSLDSYYNSINSKYSIVNLTKRYGSATYPRVVLVDMKNVAFNDDAESKILLQNRRGYSHVHQCIDCGEIASCERCSVSLTYHKISNNMICHYCQNSYSLEDICKSCNSENLKLTGTGTQKVEEELRKLFPDVNLIRMDQDTVRKRGAHHLILEKFAKGEAQILLGTQMIAKGLDFENVTLVGVINADSGLFLPDFRAGERIFQLIYQVSGRAGRHKKPGIAIVQTFNPNDSNILCASKLDIKKFYNQCLSERQELMYPPFSRLSRILISGLNKQHVNEIAYTYQRKLESLPDLTILGPAPAPIERIKNYWRFHILIKQPLDNPMILQKY
ncbi:MAG: primosomal protein N', partial [Bacteroidetes bacterium]|nr:primosomal protein N' [Bacteroidota bacterium]